MHRKVLAIACVAALLLNACNRPDPPDPEIIFPPGATVISDFVEDPAFASHAAFASNRAGDQWECWQSYSTSTRDFRYLGRGATKAAAQLNGNQQCIAHLHLGGLQKACNSVKTESCELVVKGGKERETSRPKPRLKACAGTLHRPREHVKFAGKEMLRQSASDLSTANYSIKIPASTKEITVWCRVDAPGDGWWCDRWTTGSVKGCDDNHFITTRRSVTWDGSKWEVKLKFENESRHEPRWLSIYYDYK